MIQINNGPLRGPVKSGVHLVRGEVAQLTVENNEAVFTRSDGSFPIGMVTEAWADNKVDVEFRRCHGETDVYETSEIYPVNANLYVSKNGRLTTKYESPNHPAVAMVIGPPTNGNTLRFMWL
jgi:hypothetical protein